MFRKNSLLITIRFAIMALIMDMLLLCAMKKDFTIYNTKYSLCSIVLACFALVIGIIGIILIKKISDTSNVEIWLETIDICSKLLIGISSIVGVISCNAVGYGTDERNKSLICILVVLTMGFIYFIKKKKESLNRDFFVLSNLTVALNAVIVLWVGKYPAWNRGKESIINLLVICVIDLIGIGCVIYRNKTKNNKRIGDKRHEGIRIKVASDKLHEYILTICLVLLWLHTLMNTVLLKNGSSVAFKMGSIMIFDLAIILVCTVDIIKQVRTEEITG